MLPQRSWALQRSCNTPRRYSLCYSPRTLQRCYSWPCTAPDNFLARAPALSGENGEIVTSSLRAEKTETCLHHLCERRKWTNGYIISAGRENSGVGVRVGRVGVGVSFGLPKPDPPPPSPPQVLRPVAHQHEYSTYLNPVTCFCYLIILLDRVT